MEATAIGELAPAVWRAHTSGDWNGQGLTVQTSEVGDSIQVTIIHDSGQFCRDSAIAYDKRRVRKFLLADLVASLLVKLRPGED